MPHRVRSPDDPTARLRLAARAGKLGALQKLLSREPSWRINEAREEDGWTALHLSCFWGHVDCAKALIRAGAAVDQRDVEGRTSNRRGPSCFFALVTNTYTYMVV